MQSEIETLVEPQAEIESIIPELPQHLELSPRLNPGDRIVLGLISLFALLTTICPLVGMFYRFEANYNEGWNAYNALTVARHLPLYGAKFGWTTVNYPALSFFIVSSFSSLTHDYVWIGRVLSVASFAIAIAFTAVIIRKLTTGIAPAIFGASFCVAIFCTQSPASIGANDPQTLPYIFFLGGFLLYLSKRNSLSFVWIAATVLLFVIGGNIKHNLLDFPLAVFVDLCLLSRRKAIQFVAVSIPLIALSILLNLAYGGPFFVANMLGPRGLALSVDFPPVVVLPFVVSLAWAVMALRQSSGSRRLIALLFLLSAVIGFGFGMGIGVAVNTFFSNFFAMSIIMGLLLNAAWLRTPRHFLQHPRLWRRGLPLALCSTLLLSFVLSNNFNTLRRLSELPAKQTNFMAEVSFLKAHPGPAICESLLRCFDADKPYLFDPFNATRLVHFNKLDAREIVASIEAHKFSAIQLHAHLNSLDRPNERFPNEILDAIGRGYVLALDNPGCAIYLPRH